VNQEEFWIIGGIQGQASGDSSGIPSTSLFQTGMMMMWPTDTPPSGWLVCNGLSQLTADYPALSALLRPIFGGPNAASFYLPPFPGRAPIGAGTGDATDATLHTLASKTGTEGAKLTNVGQMPSHHHGSATAGLISPPTITTGAPSPNTSDLNVAANTGAPSPNTSDGPSTPSTGAGTAHSHDPIGGVTYHLGTGGIANRISASLSGGGGVTTIASPAILTDEASHTHPMQSHTHTMANHVHAAPQHTHTMANHTHSSTMPSHDHTITAQGNSDSHPNMQPSLTVHFIIKT